jgi:hypothetical protein
MEYPDDFFNSGTDAIAGAFPNGLSGSSATGGVLGSYSTSSPQSGKPIQAFQPNYSATSFDSSKYSLKGMSYPENLMSSEEYGNNRVVFYINVSVDSRVIKNGGDTAQVVEGVQRNERGALIGQKITSGQAIGASTAAGAAGGTVIGALGGSAGGGGVLGAAIGAGTGGVISANVNNGEVLPAEEKDVKFQRPQKRLKTAIALYIPNQLNARYSASWGEEDTAAFSALAKGAGEIGRALKGDGDIKRTGGIALDVLTAAAINMGPMGKEMGIATGLAANPKKEQAFKNVDFRTFSFDYQFAPKSATEAENVLNIIRAFKYHMHPEFKDTTGFLYIYPSEFDIVYYKGTQENLNIHRHTSCVLTEMNVNYTPNGVFSTFANGMPTQINITLTFKELMLLSKELIEKFT